MGKFMEDFKAFINKGNVIDMAVGVVVATAFGKITSSLVGDIIMPLVSLATGGHDMNALRIRLTPDTVNEAGETVAGLFVNYGTFIQTIVDFLIIALCVFAVLRVITKSAEKAKALAAKKKAEEEKKEEEKPAEPSAEEKLLTEIRDLLKEGK